MNNWYVLHTKPNLEKKVAAALTKKGIKTCLPVVATQHNWMVTQTISHKPVFPTFLFVNVPVTDHQQLRKVPGVVGLLHRLDQPAIINDAEINMMNRFVEEHHDASFLKIKLNIPLVSVAETGAATPAELTLLRDDTKITLVLPSMGYSLTVDQAEKKGIGHTTRYKLARRYKIKASLG